MNRDRILQVRLDAHLRDALAQYVERLRAHDPKVSESQAARKLLRQALGQEGIETGAVGDAAYREGLLRGYDEVRRAITAAVQPLLGKREPGR